MTEYIRIQRAYYTAKENTKFLLVNKNTLFKHNILRLIQKFNSSVNIVLENFTRIEPE